MASMSKEKNTVPIAVIMISLNEEHNMEAVCKNLAGWAQEVFLVDSYSKDRTVDIALEHGVHVVQRPFRNFGDQWNFSLSSLPISAPWTMKLDPDERITDKLKSQIEDAIAQNECDGIEVVRQLFFMQRGLHIRQKLPRVWRTGKCRFTDVPVNEHPIIEGHVIQLDGEIEHHDSPDLEHWLDKQNRYTTMEAVIAYKGSELAEKPIFFGTRLQRRMWLKKNFSRIPCRFKLLFLYNLLVNGAWRSGRVGWIWSSLRSDVMRYRELKRFEMELTGRIPLKRVYGPGIPDARVHQYE
jgi:glycosyltransferase involved in cell wall biosynthesis